MQIPYRIIVIEDDPQALDVIRETLEGLGSNLMLAEEASEGIAKALEEPPSLLLINLAAQGTGGLDVCKKIHGNESTQDVPIILLTLREGKFDPVYTRLYGIVGFISKPLTRDTLLMGLTSHAPPEVMSALETGSSSVSEEPELADMSGHYLENPAYHEGTSGVPAGEEDTGLFSLDDASFGQPMEELARAAVESDPSPGTEPATDQESFELETTRFDDFSGSELSIGALDEGMLETHRVQETGDFETSAGDGPEEDSLGGPDFESDVPDDSPFHSAPAEDPTLDEATIERALTESPEPSIGEHMDEVTAGDIDRIAKTLAETEPAPLRDDQPKTESMDGGMSFDEDVLSGIAGGSLESPAESHATLSESGSTRMESAMAAARAKRYQSKRPRYRPHRRKQSGSRAFVLAVLLLILAVAAAASYVFLSGHAMKLPWKFSGTGEQASPSQPPPAEVITELPETPQVLEDQTSELSATGPAGEQTSPDVQTAAPSPPVTPAAETVQPPSPSDLKSPEGIAPPVERGDHYVQFGMFSSEGNAHRLVSELKKAGYNTTVRRDRFRSGKIAYRVVLNRAYESSQEAETKAKTLLRESGRKTYVYSP
jgi:CheY-like chemotaxis protein